MTPTRIPTPRETRYIFMIRAPGPASRSVPLDRTDVQKRIMSAHERALMTACDELLCCRPGAGFACMLAEHGPRVDQSQPIRSAEVSRQACDRFVGFGAGPVALHLEHVLQRGHRPDAALHHSLHGALVRFLGDVTAGIGDHVYLEALVECRQ